MIIPSALTILVIATASYAQFASVSADLNTIATHVSSLDTELKAFPTSGANIASALAIHAQATGLASALTTAAAAVSKAGPVTDAQAQQILTFVQGIEPTILDALHQLVAKKSGFVSLPISGASAIIAQDIAKVQTNAKDFENALIADAPPHLLPTAASMTSAIDAALASASAAYSKN
ncbi:hypothetical protein D9757_010587 [Collybiopsis confluens]|uniref:Hydrophobic surface binding protein n=1 Tax=Collybiopsis confluens TaxID=2823264 RepID=A0A8H5GVM7_9AGAR|nr:hypothetical protein D9757_010587 [Collybiopsis confluens]